jgi:hypothetical protein
MTREIRFVSLRLIRYPEPAPLGNGQLELCQLLPPIARPVLRRPLRFAAT